MLLRPFQIPTRFTVRFRISGVPIVLRDPNQTQYMNTLQGNQVCFFEGVLSEDHFAGTPYRPQELHETVLHFIRSWLVKATEPTTHRSRQLVIDILSTSIEKISDLQG